MLDYYIIIFLPTLFFYLGKKNKFFEKIALLFLILFGFFRYDFGIDYETYQVIHKVLNKKIEVMDNYYQQAVRMELGFKYLNQSIDNFQIMIGLITMINLILVYKGIKYYLKDNSYLGIYIYLSTFQLFFYNLSAIRQSVANAVYFFSIRYIINRKLVKFLLFIFIGSMFHKSILLLIPTYLIYNIEFLEKYKANCFIGVMLGIICLKTTGIFNVIINFLNKLNLTRYALELEKAALAPTKFTILLFVINSVVLLFILYFFPVNNTKEKTLYKFIVISYIFSLLKIFGIKALHRVENYFMFFEIIGIPYLLFNLKIKQKVKALIVFILIIVYALIFYIRIQKQNLESDKYKEVKIILLKGDRK